MQHAVGLHGEGEDRIHGGADDDGSRAGVQRRRHMPDIGRNDDLHVYGVPSAPTAFEEIEILFNPGPDAVEAFWNNPYDCEVLIISDGGARLITIPAPKPLNLPQTPEDLLQFEINWLT